jgi:uncharacterized phage protein (TIGR02220 family)
MSTIKRSKRQTPFVQIDKRPLQDKSLGWKAKGILAYLLSLPDDWQLYVDELKDHAKDGRDSTSGGLNELIKHGYVTRHKKRSEGGRFKGYGYTVYETPQNQPVEIKTPKTDKPQTEKPSAVNPKTDKPKSVNPQLLILNNTNKDNTNKKDDKQNLSIPAPKNPMIEFKKVLTYLTEKSGNKFRLGEKVKQSDKYVKITARLQDYTIGDLKAVIDVKCKEWKDKPEWKPRLVPATLFCKKHFGKYLDEAENDKQQPQNAPTPQDNHKLSERLEKSYLERVNSIHRKTNGRISYFTRSEFASWLKGGSNFEKWRNRGMLEIDIPKKIKSTINYLSTSTFAQGLRGDLNDHVEAAFQGKIKQIS